MAIFSSNAHALFTLSHIEQKDAFENIDTALKNAPKIIDELRQSARDFRQLSDKEIPQYRDILKEIKDKLNAQSGDVSLSKTIDKSVTLFSKNQNERYTNITRVIQTIIENAPLINLRALPLVNYDDSLVEGGYQTQIFSDGAKAHLGGIQYRNDDSLLISQVDEKLTLFSEYLTGYAAYAEKTAEALNSFLKDPHSLASFLKEVSLLEKVISYKEKREIDTLKKIMNELKDNYEVANLILRNIITSYPQEEILDLLNALASFEDPHGTIIRFLVTNPDILVTKTGQSIQRVLLTKAVQTLIKGKDPRKMTDEELEANRYVLNDLRVFKAIEDTMLEDHSNSLEGVLKELSKDPAYIGQTVALSVLNLCQEAIQADFDEE